MKISCVLFAITTVALNPIELVVAKSLRSVLSRNSTIGEESESSNVELRERNLDERFELRKIGNKGQPYSVYPLPMCKGDCDNDRDCAGDLVCFQRKDGDYTKIPGCTGNPHKGTDYCYSHGPAKPTGTPYYPETDGSSFDGNSYDGSSFDGSSYDGSSYDGIPEKYYPENNYPMNPHEFQVDDLGCRFNKFGSGGPNGKMTTHHYPMKDPVATLVRRSLAISVTTEEDCTLCDETPAHNLIMDMGGYPFHPGKDPNNPYWGEFYEVLTVQWHRRQGADTSVYMPLPKTWKPYKKMDDAAEQVNDEIPGKHHMHLLEYLFKTGAKVDKSMIPSKSKTEFLKQEVACAEIATWAISEIGYTNFKIKWFVGRCRPEEVAFKITTGEYNEYSGVPKEIVDKIKQMQLRTPEDFTAYKQGCPRHPSFPAMHSAASAMSTWAPTVLMLTKEQICQCKLLDWAIAFARTLAGVHYPSDNLAGLKLGQKLMYKNLPPYLSKKYGADPNALRLISTLTIFHPYSTTTRASFNGSILRSQHHGTKALSVCHDEYRYRGLHVMEENFLQFRFISSPLSYISRQHISCRTAKFQLGGDALICRNLSFSSYSWCA